MDIVIQQNECIYGMTYEYIQTYMHIDTACVQHVNVGLAQARPNYVLNQELEWRSLRHS